MSRRPTERELSLRQMIRLRAVVRATLALAVIVSLAANILHSDGSWVGRCVSGWPPVALVLTIDLLSRVPVGSTLLATIRMTAALVIAAIAALISYGHMLALAADHGEPWLSAHLLPLSVDGLVIVASVSLVELGARIAELMMAQRAKPSEPSAPKAREPKEPSVSEPLMAPPVSVPSDGEMDESSVNGAQRVLEAIGDSSISPAKLQLSTGLSRAQVGKLLRELVELGQIDKIGRGQYQRRAAA